MKVLFFNSERIKRLSIIWVCIVYFFGILGIQSSYQAWFLRFTGASICLATGVLLLHHTYWNSKFVIAIMGATLVGFLVEVWGVHSGILFGNYYYGASLGIKLWDVPIVIGVNWLLLAYCSYAVASFLKVRWFWKCVVGALLMTGLDVIIEPVAVHYDFWQWHGDLVPLQNYLGWFVISLCILLLFYILDVIPNKRVGGLFFLLQVVFFVMLQ